MQKVFYINLDINLTETFFLIKGNGSKIVDEVLRLDQLHDDVLILIFKYLDHDEKMEAKLQFTGPVKKFFFKVFPFTKYKIFVRYYFD